MSLVRRILTAGLFVALILSRPVVAFAQGTPELEKGFCAPWHRCLAFGTLGLALGAVLMLFVGYMLQRRGFDKIEHRQGNPEGVDSSQH